MLLPHLTASFVWLRWKLNRTEPDLSTRRCKHTPWVVLHVLESTQNYGHKKWNKINEQNDRKRICLEGQCAIMFIHTAEHFRASRHVAVTVIRLSSVTVIHNSKFYMLAFSWSLIESVKFCWFFSTSPTTSGPYGRVFEEDRSQRGSHLYQQRHSILHGSPYPYPSAQSLFLTGRFGHEFVTVVSVM